MYLILITNKNQKMTIKNINIIKNMKCRFSLNNIYF